MRKLLDNGAEGVMGTDISLLGLKKSMSEIDVINLDQNLCVEKSEEQRLALMSCDICKEDDVKNLFCATLKIFGRVDVAIANAAISQSPKSIMEESFKTMRQISEVNIHGGESRSADL